MNLCPWAAIKRTRSPNNPSIPYVRVPCAALIVLDRDTCGLAVLRKPPCEGRYVKLDYLAIKGDPPTDYTLDVFLGEARITVLPFRLREVVYLFFSITTHLQSKAIKK